MAPPQGCLVLARAQLVAAATDGGAPRCLACGAAVSTGTMCPRCRSVDIGRGPAKDAPQPGLLLWGAAILVTLGGLAGALRLEPRPLALVVATASLLAGAAIATLGGRVRLSGVTS